MSKENNIISIFPLPEIVLFPGMNLPLHIFEEHYKKMVSDCIANKEQFGIVYTKGNVCAEVGTIAKIIDVEKLEDGKMNILTEGTNRFKIVNLLSTDPYYTAQIEPYEDKEIKITENLKKTLNKIRDLSSKALSIFDEISDEELSKKLKLPEMPNELLFLIAANLTCSYEAKQSILETQSIKERSNEILTLLKEEIKRLEVLLENKETKKDVIKNGKLKI